MARRFWPGARALGARLRVGADEAGAEWGVVVGIVGDVRSDPALTLAEPAVYLPARQSPLRSSLFYLIRGQGDVLELVDPFRATLIELDPGVPMDEVGTLEARLAARFDVQRLPTLLLGSFALLALALAAVGVYSLFSSLTNSRRQEFGVRLALGSSPWSIAGLVVKQGGTWALVGLAGGALGIALVGRALRGVLFDVAPLDPLAIALSITLLVIVGALALLSPVRRAARTEAVEILR
jgi:hypothetical protein